MVGQIDNFIPWKLGLKNWEILIVRFKPAVGVLFSVIFLLDWSSAYSKFDWAYKNDLQNQTTLLHKKTVEL